MFKCFKREKQRHKAGNSNGSNRIVMLSGSFRFLSLVFLSFEFVSCFVLRISVFNSQGNCLRASPGGILRPPALREERSL
jgi:hypothetical protein